METVATGSEAQGLTPVIDNLKSKLKSTFDCGVDFVKKGAERRQTYFRLKELTAERLKNVPNYVVLEAAKKHIRLGVEAILALSLVGNLIFVARLIDVSDKLTQKRIALVPSLLS